MVAHRVQARMEREAFTHTGKRFLLAPGLGASMVLVRGLQGELAPARSKDQVCFDRGGEGLSVEIPHAGAKRSTHYPY